MDEQKTKGISDIGGFQSVNSGENSGGTFYDKSVSEGNDRLGIKHWPSLFSYMESHSSFSAAVLSVIGYVIIAAFGSMETLGQYLGYIIFLSIIGFTYNFNKKGGKYLYLFIAVILLLIGFIVFQNWSKISSYYRTINKPFQVDVQVPEISTPVVSPE